MHKLNKKNLLMIAVHKWKITLDYPLCQENAMEAELGETALEIKDKS